MQNTIREAIYGKVVRAAVLRRRSLADRLHCDATPGKDPQNIPIVEWEVVPGEFCAVKEMSLNHIRRGRSSLAEDPIKEVSVMQHIAKDAAVADSPSMLECYLFMKENNTMIAKDVLLDDHCLYMVLPYCNGGEFFDRLYNESKFTEPHARYWMRQILSGLQYLQSVGICHRDVSLENILIHDNTCVIMDFGMSLCIPFRDPLACNDTNGATHQTGERLLITPQGTCGKWNFMSPEICANDAFDGFAVDMWAAGVILFIMLTGIPAWDRPHDSDEQFKHLTGGNLVFILNHWNMGLSVEAMDLLEKMFKVNPMDRLSLEQVQAHPWIINEDVEIPMDTEDESYM